jgi:methylthioribose-1-phosphate isomerase
MNKNIETLRWSNDVFEMIDQRVLPFKFDYISCDSALSVADAIRNMIVRGAPAIGCAAAFGIALEALKSIKYDNETFKLNLSQGFEVLSASRPTAVNLFWALNRMKKIWEKYSNLNHELIAENLLNEAIAIMQEDIAINKSMGSYGAELLADEARVLTHCNAGALATAGHGTALGVIRSAVEMGKRITVIADETRPFLQGARLTAWELLQDSIPVTLITDNMAGYLMSRGEIDAIIVGTDRVASNGDVANKIGTYMVAVLAKRHNIPFYVACPISTIDMNCKDGNQIPIEERSADEVTGFGELSWAAEGVRVRNPSFDVTPAELVTALITEKGVIFNPDNKKLSNFFKINKL